MIYKIMCMYIYIYLSIYLYLSIFIFMFISIYGIRSKKRSSGWCVGTYSIEGPFGKSTEVLLHGGHMVPGSLYASHERRQLGFRALGV